MLITLKIYNWGSKKTAQTDEPIEVGKKYIVQNNFGQFIGTVISVKRDPAAPQSSDLKISGSSEEDRPLNNGEDYLKIVRQAAQEDLKKVEEFKNTEKEILTACHAKIKQYELPMKLVGANQSLDSSSVIIAFISENRVDFRELVRDMARTFQKAIRLEQIGSRDEARIRGGFGPCGRELCCIKFNGPLKSINTDMARVQQITHRGSERISGCCGRLICCLAYELEHYEELMKNMPEAGETVKVNGTKGTVKTLKVLQRKALIRFEKGSQVEEKWFPLKDIEVLKRNRRRRG